MSGAAIQLLFNNFNVLSVFHSIVSVYGRHFIFSAFYDFSQSFLI